MPSGDLPGSQPAETVRDQVMRTLSAVRTRLRGTFPDSDGQQLVSGAAPESHDNGNGQGAAPAAAVDLPPSPMDPLLGRRRRNGRGSYPPPSAAAVAAAAAAEASVEAPPEFEAPVAEPDIVEAPSRRETPPGPAMPAAPAEVVEAPTEPLPGPSPETSSTVTNARRARMRPALPLLRRRPRVRKVTRIVRRVDAWGVFKISVIFYVILYIILLVAGVLLWNLANTTGTVANVEGFVRDLFGLKTFEFDGEKLFRASWVLGAVLVIAGTGLNVTLAVLFNLISDLVGGVRVTVLEEEVILRERPVLPTPAAPADDADAEPPMFPAPAYAELPPPGMVDADAPPASV